MTLDLRGVLRAGLDHVGIEGALNQEAGIVELVASDLFEDPDERLADDLALAFRIGDAREVLEETIGGFHVDQIHLQVTAEGFLDLLGFAGAQQTVVHEDARELIPHGLVYEGRRHR